MDDWLPPLPDELPRVLTRAQLIDRGFTARMIERRVGSGRWQRVLPCTYVTSDTVTWLDRRRAAVAFGGGGAVLSGAAALCDLGLRGVTRPDRLLVLVPGSSRTRSTQYVRIRPTARLPVADLRPGPRSAPCARAVADLAVELRRLDDVRTLVAEVVRRRLCTLVELDRELGDGPRRNSRHLRDAVEEVGGNAWSAPEAFAARLLRDGGAPPFEQNVTIRLPHGQMLIVDFLWRALRAVLEIDSDEHHSLPPDADHTDDRHVRLETLGFSVVHRRPAYIRRNPVAFASEIASWLAAREQMISSSATAGGGSGADQPSSGGSGSSCRTTSRETARVSTT